MKAILLGSTGMIGKSVLLECLDDVNISDVLLINRRHLDVSHAKIKEIIHGDFFDFSSLSDTVREYDCCFFCLGVSSVGMKEEQYRRLTYELTLAFARTLMSANPNAVFCYVTGAGTDGTEKGSMMWARVKGMTENALLALGFKDAYMFRPGFILPLKGVKAKSSVVNFFYAIFTPFYYILKPFPGLVTNSVILARAMINAVVHGYGKKVLETKDINILGRHKQN